MPSRGQVQKAGLSREAASEESPPDRIRLTLDVTPQMKEVIDTLADQVGTTQSDILRRAIALLKAVKEAEAKGEGTAAIAKGDRVVVRLVGY